MPMPIKNARVGEPYTGDKNEYRNKRPSTSAVHTTKFCNLEHHFICPVIP